MGLDITFHKTKKINTEARVDRLLRTYPLCNVDSDIIRAVLDALNEEELFGSHEIFSLNNTYSIKDWLELNVGKIENAKTYEMTKEQLLQLYYDCKEKKVKANPKDKFYDYDMEMMEDRIPDILDAVDFGNETLTFFVWW